VVDRNIRTYFVGRYDLEALNYLVMYPSKSRISYVQN